MTEQDFIRAVESITPDEQLKRKVLSGERPTERRKRRVQSAFRFAACAAAALVVFFGADYARSAMKPVGTASFNGQAANSAVSPSGSNGGNLYYDAKVRNVLLLGLNESGSSDCMMLFSVDRRKGREQLLITSFPRDLYVDIPGNGKNRINSAYTLGGASKTVQAIENNFKIRVDDFVTVNFDGFVGMIDQLGGLSLNLTEKEAQLIHQQFGDEQIKAGNSVLTGKQALYYCRIGDADGELQRNKREQAAMAAVVDRLKAVNRNSYTDLFQKLTPFLNMSINVKTAAEFIAQDGANLDFPIRYYLPSANLLNEQMVQISGGRTAVLVPDLERYQESLKNAIYQNNAS